MFNLRPKIIQSMVLIAVFLLYSFPLEAASLSRAQEQTAQNSCKVTVNGLNLRAGAGTQFNKVGQLARGAILLATGRNSDESWVFGSSATVNGWAAVRFLTCSASISQLPVTDESVSAPEAASAAPTAAPAAAAPATGSTTGTVSSVTLVGPLDAKLSGRQTFRWQTTTAPAANQGFLLVFWEPGQDPLTNGFAVQGPSSASEASIDLDKVMGFVPKLKPEKEYQWGVLLVRLHPPKRLKFLGGGQQFLLVSSTIFSGSGAQPTAPAPPAPPK